MILNHTDALLLSEDNDDWDDDDDDFFSVKKSQHTNGIFGIDRDKWDQE